MEVQTKGVDCLWEQGVRGALVCTTNHWFAIRIIGEVVWVLDSLHCGPRRLGTRGDEAIAQFFDKYEFAFLVHESSIGHGHPEDSGHGQKVFPKPEILKIERESAKGADVHSVSSDRAEDVYPHQQSGPKASDVHSPQCVGKAKPFDLESKDYTPGEEPHYSDASKVLQHMEVDRGLFQQHVQDVLDCFLRGGDCVALLCSLPRFASSVALLSDEVELRLMENAFASLRGQTVNGNAATQVSIPIWLCHPWPLCVLAEAWAQCTSVPGVFHLDCMLSSFNALLHKDVTLDACGFKIRPRFWVAATGDPGPRTLFTTLHNTLDVI